MIDTSKKNKTVRGSLRTRLMIVFMGLAVIPLLLVGLVLGWRSVSVQQAQALDLQEQVAQRVAGEVQAFMHIRENDLYLLTKVSSLRSLEKTRQSDLLSGLMQYQSEYQDIYLLDDQGQEQVHVAREVVYAAADLANHAGLEEFEAPKASGQIYYSAVDNNQTGEPLMTIAIPLTDLRTGQFAGVLAARFRFKAIWELMTSGSEDGSVYMIDATGKVVAHHNPSVVLRGDRLGVHLDKGFTTGLEKTRVALAESQFSLGQQKFSIVAEMPAAKALTLATSTLYITLGAIGIALLFAIGLGIIFSIQITRPINTLVSAAQAIHDGDLSQRAAVKSRDEIGVLARVFNEMAQELQQMLVEMEQRITERTRSAEQARQEAETARLAVEKQMWLTAGQAQLSNKVRGEQDIPALANNVMHHLCTYLGVQVGTLFVRDGDMLKLVGDYAYTPHKGAPTQIKVGEGLIGQAALENRSLVMAEIPPDYLTIASSLGAATPKSILILPFSYNKEVVGVIELGALTTFTAEQSQFLEMALENVAVAFNTARARGEINRLLVETQRQADILKMQEEELRAANEELQAQTDTLSASQEKLREQQTELEEANAELEEKAAALQAQQAILDRQNSELKTTQQELKKKAEDLALASKYKSEFLANMSHELRSPLNSLLILARILANNEAKNLLPDQVESANIIYNSGNDLLALINEILDLSKVEAGKMQFHIAPMPLTSVAQSMQIQFAPIANEKGVTFEVLMDADLPTEIETDQQRVQQIIKNLLSNAFKFTAQGGVKLSFERPTSEVELASMKLPPAQAIAIRVTDTGIGMTPKQQEIVFEAFQQADGSTSRKYGGTGLGLTISRELATQLNGKIELQSEYGKGSTFTLYLPTNQPVATPEAKKSSVNIEPLPILNTPGENTTEPEPAPPLPAAANVQDDRDQLRKGDKILLIIEDDLNFARIVYNHAHTKDFKSLIAETGETGITMMKAYHPDAVILDLKLPDMSGWEVLNVLKQDPDTRHIPVHVLSAMDETLDAYKMGAIGFLSKPISQEGLEDIFQKIGEFISRDIKTLLLVEDDANLRHGIRQLLSGGDVKISEASLGEAALEQLRSQPFDCMILDLRLPDMTGFELLNRMNADEKVSKCPVIVYTGQALTEEQNAELMKYADSVIIKGVKSPERLIDETALFLHRVVARLPEEKQRAIKQLHNSDTVLNGKHILVVDDDTRNAFALSKLLGDKGLEVSLARSGIKALEILDARSDIDLILMDIMMPEMDGYETIRRIRGKPALRSIPILAVTAKAMQGDQEKCIEAGANDYLSKPVQVERLFSMLRVWLYR